MEQGEGGFHDPAVLVRSAAVLGAASAHERADTQVADLAAVRVMS
ncbi:hypothetical protein ACWERW_40565 [Streptomyces sp. NPDC004012]